jgi:chromosome segregation protein
MKFNRLRVLGFKSFVEPTDFIIERGLTGVVGPNGCGKSNLVEALRWVMGENSYKNMRASGMDDVIFSGSGNRPARNTAEVTLFLDNSDRTAPAAFNAADELQVSRRIEREAGSLYRINGKEARAKDVQLLFADQSTGARSPSMVGQGRIGELIQAKPQARRALLEEAAGISGLHTRRHEAELRLRGAEQNLERLEDVVGELQTQIENLRRQARQATRFKNLSADIRQAEATLLHLRWTQARQQEAEAGSALTAATRNVAAAAAAQMEAAKAQGVGAHHLPVLRDAEAAAGAAFQRLRIARTQLEEEARRIAARGEELAKRIAQADGDIARERQLLADNADVLRRLDEEEARLKAENAAADEQAVHRQKAFEDAAVKLAAGEDDLARITRLRAEAAAERTQFERAVRDGLQRRDRFAQQALRLEGELADIARRIDGLPDPAEKKNVLVAHEEALMQAEADAAACEAALAEARAAEKGARDPLGEARAELARIETEARTLEKVLSATISGKFAPVLESIKVAPGCETALGAALGEDLDLPLDAAAPARWAMVEVAKEDPTLPAGLPSLGQKVDAPPQLARRLSQIALVEDHTQGEALQGALKVGQQLVSRDGAVWRWDGYVASADAPTPAAQRLAQKNRLAELEAQLDEARRRVASAEDNLRAVEAAIRSAADAERIARESVRSAQKAVALARDELVAAERASGELATRRGVLDESRAATAEELAEAERLLGDAQAALQKAPDLAALEQEFDLAAQRVAQDRAGLADARSANEDLRRQSENRIRRLTAIMDERAAWRQRADNAQSQIASLEARKAEAAGEQASLADRPDEIGTQLRELLSQLARAEEQRKAAADKLQHAENAQRALDAAANDAIQTLSQAREQRGRAEERQAAAEDRRKEAEARIQEVLAVPPHMVARHAGLEPDAPLPDMADTERQLERLKIERERLGAVNLRAEEEQRELTERLDLIVNEREDVIEAIRKLRQAIQNLNREGRERLLAAFEVVNEQFRRLFTHLFGGGTAELQLIESEDPLDAGLEILARPPGKKPQTMTLLSGGEQALTAMALIFAVFLTNPAPICVLDEVDAPLDDHNVERFCNLMDEMSATTETRFVIITHNPITMARMDRLFGVTMVERGVSQLVSVDLQTAEQMREAS